MPIPNDHKHVPQWNCKSHAAASHLKTLQKTKTWTVLREITKWTQSKDRNKFLLVQLHDQKNIIKCNALFMMMCSTHTFFIWKEST